MSQFVFWCNIRSRDSGPLNHSIDFLRCLIESGELNTLSIFARTSKVEEGLNKYINQVKTDSHSWTGGRGLVFSSILYQLRSFINILKIIENRNRSIIYFRHTPFLFIPIFLKIVGVKNIFVEINGIPNQFLLERKQGERRHFFRKRALFEFDKVLFRSVDGLFTVCEVFKKNIQDHYHVKSRIEVIPNGCFIESTGTMKRDKAIDECRLNKNRKYAIYVGNIEAKFEGVEFLISAFIQICKKPDLEEWDLLILGKEPNDNHLKDLIPAEFSDRVQFKGVQSRDKMYHHIAASHIGVYTPPTIEYGIDGQRGGSALKLVDYLSAGCPILVPRSKYYDYVDQFKCGLRYKPEDISSFMEQFEKLGNDEEKVSEYGINARQYAINYLNWSKTLQPVIDLVRSRTANMNSVANTNHQN